MFRTKLASLILSLSLLLLSHSAFSMETISKYDKALNALTEKVSGFIVDKNIQDPEDLLAAFICVSVSIEKCMEYIVYFQAGEDVWKEISDLNTYLTLSSFTRHFDTYVTHQDKQDFFQHLVLLDKNVLIEKFQSDVLKIDKNDKLKVSCESTLANIDFLFAYLYDPVRVVIEHQVNKISNPFHSKLMWSDFLNLYPSPSKDTKNILFKILCVHLFEKKILDRPRINCYEGPIPLILVSAPKTDSNFF